MEHRVNSLTSFLLLTAAIITDCGLCNESPTPHSTANNQPPKVLTAEDTWNNNPVRLGKDRSLAKDINLNRELIGDASVGDDLLLLPDTAVEVPPVASDETAWMERRASDLNRKRYK